MHKNGKKPKTFWFGVALILALLLGGQVGRTASGKPANAGKTRVVTLIFCDLTASVDSAAIEKVARDVYKTMLSLPQETRLYILPIDESPFVKPILDFTYPKAARFSEIAKNKTRVRAAANHAYNAIKKLYCEEFSRPAMRPKPLSCLLRSLETADRYFSQFRGGQDEQFVFELVYFSDMIEECGNSPAGPVFLTKEHYSTALNSLKAYRPDFDLSYANVSIIVSVDDYGEDSPYISSGQLFEFWKNVFMKTGFTAEQINKFNFLATLPERFNGKKSPWK